MAPSAGLPQGLLLKGRGLLLFIIIISPCHGEIPPPPRDLREPPRSGEIKSLLEGWRSPKSSPSTMPAMRSPCRPLLSPAAGPCLLLLLLLLGATSAPWKAQAAAMTGELRCRCIEKVSDVIPPKHIVNIELTPEGPHCPVSEVIAILKSGKQVCLDPSARWVKIIINRILRQGPTNL